MLFALANSEESWVASGRTVLLKSIEITVAQDPVPYKGTFSFTPDNGRAWVAFPMRSGTGGQVKAVAECSRHGRFTGTRDLRVADGGCTTGPEPIQRDRLGNPALRIPGSGRAGDVIEVKTKVDHNSQTGLALRNGKFVREGTEFYVKQMLVFVDGRQVSDFRMSSAVSANPVIRFPLKAARSGTVRVVFVNSEGLKWEISQPLRV